jgi:inner membrane transporter RhtA
VIAVAFFFQTGSALATRVISSVGIVDALWLRTAIAAILLVALRPRSLRLPIKGRRLPIVMLTLSLLAMNLSFYGAISRAPLGIVVAIEFLGPLSVALIGLHRKLDFLWIALALAGVVILAGPTSSVSALGIGLSLVAACSWGAFLVLAKRAVTSMPPLQVTTLMLAGSSVLLTPTLAAWGPRMVHHPSAIALGAVVAVLSSALPYFVELIALRLVRASTYGVLLSLEPAVAALMGFVVAGQSLALVETAAIVAVMIAAAGASWTSRPRPTGLEVG